VRDETVRYYGAYASRTRGARRARQAEAAAAAAVVAAADSGAPGQPTAPAQPAPPSEPAPRASPSRANWAPLLRRIFEVDPLLCPRCGGRLAIVAVLTDPKVVDRILRHLTERGLPTSSNRSVHARDPPSAAADPSANPSAA